MSDGLVQGVRLLASRYEVGALIGRGGMADVYLGTDTRLGRRVAIKLLKTSLATDPAFRTRFRREAHDAAKMAHPTIVRIFDAGEEVIRESDGSESLLPFIVMEYVDGRLLRDVIAEGPLEPAEAVRITSQLLTALEYSHRAGVVHRDIKPGNVMLSSGGQVKVMDFGIARAVSESAATIAETSAIVGTAQYFSPEQARGEQVDARSDLYSTGVVLFELLTGRAPFRGDNPVAVAYQHVNAEPVAPSALAPGVSPALDAVVLRALAKDRFERYQSAEEFRTELESAQAGSVPPRTQLAVQDFNATLFGVNPSAVAGSETALRQLSADHGDRAVRTQNRPPVAWIWTGIVAMVAIVAAVVYWVFTLTPPTLTDNLSVEVPGVEGQSWAVGERALEDSRLEADRLDQPSETVAEGLIISTDPVAGTVVAPGMVVKVFVSTGPTPVLVPDLLRLTEAEAKAAIEAAGLVYGSTTVNYSADVPSGLVMSSTPAGGSDRYPTGQTVREGDIVDLVVSNGLVSIPDVRGQTIAQANSAMASLQLPVKVDVDHSCGGGTIAAQSHIGENPQRTTVTLRYCAG